MAATITVLRQATPARWQKALARALAGGIQVRQLAGTGAWVATSASDPRAAYEVAVTNGMAHGCACKAGQHGDPVCCHRAAFYHFAGLLDLDPEPEPPAPAMSAPVVCFACGGSGRDWAGTGEEATQYPVPCVPCDGAGVVEVRKNQDGDEGWESAPYDWRPAA
ncbi:MAG: hypothetical protein M3Q10_07960 [Chloroflexota bacterium]|nr:hypothetical protein [Chloroflexota bacterium]